MVNQRGTSPMGYSSIQNLNCLPSLCHMARPKSDSSTLSLYWVFIVIKVMQFPAEKFSLRKTSVWTQCYTKYINSPNLYLIKISVGMITEMKKSLGSSNTSFPFISCLTVLSYTVSLLSLLFSSPPFFILFLYSQINIWH